MPSLPTGKPTRDDVARLAGVSTAVVSYVMNGSKPVSAKTAAKVQAAVEKLGYRPNQAARALRLGSSETLGIVIPDATNPFFFGLTHEVELAAAERGYSLLTANADGSPTKERRQIENLIARRVDGMILCSTLSRPDGPTLARAETPFVLLNQFDAIPGVPSVGVDLRAGARLAVEHLMSHGHRTIGLVAGTTADDTRDARHAGWRDAIKANGLTPGPVVKEGFTPLGGYAAARWLLSTGTLPTALFVSSDQLAKGVLKALHEEGVRVPEDVAIVSFDDTPDADFLWPPLTTIAQPISAMAHAAVDVLIDGVDDERAPLFSPTLVRRVSCGCGAGEI